MITAAQSSTPPPLPYLYITHVAVAHLTCRLVTHTAVAYDLLRGCITWLWYNRRRRKPELGADQPSVSCANLLLTWSAVASSLSLSAKSTMLKCSSKSSSRSSESVSHIASGCRCAVANVGRRKAAANALFVHALPPVQKHGLGTTIVDPSHTVSPADPGGSTRAAIALSPPAADSCAICAGAKCHL